ncbi:MAG: BtaA family protein [Myxococcales bacterium]|nr:BtaA family protein [Myxococcales bacterium]
MGLRDRAFQRAFATTFVYNILFEDSEVDETYLGLDADSTVLSISGAGCGIAGMMSGRPRRVDAVDINRHHLALTALKCTAAQRMRVYDDFYDLMGRGWSHEPEQHIAALAQHMPPWVARYWKRHAKRFRKGSLYLQGLTARMLGVVRQQAGLGLDWARQVCAMDVDERVTTLHRTLGAIDTPVLRAFMSSPVQLMALGINFQQRDRLVATEQSASMTDYFVEHLTRVMSTDLWNNWFFWYAAAGTFNHTQQDALPPYLRQDRWEKSLNGPTDVRYRHGNLFDVLDEAGPGTWSHYTLCDAVDWMPPAVQRRLFEEIRRTARPGATVLLRSVETEDPVQAVGAEFLHKLPCSAEASLADRSRQYRQVNFYEVHA